MKIVLPLLLAFLLLIGCSKNSSEDISYDSLPTLQYTAQWNIGNGTSSSSIVLDTFSSHSRLSSPVLWREIYTDQNDLTEYYLSASDSNITTINSLQFYVKNIAVGSYRIDSSSLNNQTGNIGFVSAVSIVKGKDMYTSLIKGKKDYFDLNITSLSPDSLISGNFDCSMSSFRGMGSNSPTIVLSGGYIVKNGIFNNIPIKTVYTKKQTVGVNN